MQEGLHLNPDGTVTLAWELENGEQFQTTLKRPRLKAYRQAREFLNQISQSTQEVRRELLRKQQTVNRLINQTATDLPDKPSEEEVSEQIDQLGAETKSLIEQIDLGACFWIERQIEVMGDRKLTPITDDEGVPQRDKWGYVVYNRDEYPSWVMDAQLPHSVIDHWRRVPLAPGSKGTNS